MKIALVAMSAALLSVSLVSGCGATTCDELITRYCEQACSCRKYGDNPNGTCAAGTSGDAFPVTWGSVDDCEKNPGLVILACPSQRLLDACYESLDDIECSSAKDGTPLLLTPDACR